MQRSLCGKFDFSPALGSYFTRHSEGKDVWWAPSFSEGWDGPWMFKRFIRVNELAFKDLNLKQLSQAGFSLDIPQNSAVISKFDQGFHRSSPSAITAEQGTPADP